MTTLPIAPPEVDELPEAPQRLTDLPEAFVAKVDPWYAAWPAYRVQMITLGANTHQNALAAYESATAAEAAKQMALASSDLVGTTADTLDLAYTQQSFDLNQLNLAFEVGEELALVLLGNSRVRMNATLDAFDPGTGAATVTITRVQGSGPTGTGWSVMRKSLEGLSTEEGTALAIAFAAAI